TASAESSVRLRSTVAGTERARTRAAGNILPLRHGPTPVGPAHAMAQLSPVPRPPHLPFGRTDRRRAPAAGALHRILLPIRAFLARFARPPPPPAFYCAGAEA